MSELPKKYNHIDSEQKWRDHWETEGTNKWDSTANRENTFSIDTPPPTVSGSLHIGHVFSYTQTDVVARYQRMKGKSIFYPMGWDDNGLPTERRVQNVFGISCNPNIAYDANWKPKKSEKGDDNEEVSRENFIQACSQLTKEDEAVFEHLWRKLGLSIDWDLQYATIDDHCRKMSQLSFLDLVEKDLVYNNETPAMWDVDFQTAVAQAELEDRERPGAYHDITFQIEDGGEFNISTTRPELLAACIAVVAHPEDERYKKYFGKYAITPLFHSKVPILAADHADPEKGTGILMVCTFGDAMDVEFWKQNQHLPIKQIIGRNGKLLPIEFGKAPFTSENANKAAENYKEIEGFRIKKAHKLMADLLSKPDSNVSGDDKAMKNDPKAIDHPVKFYEKGDTPIEFIPTRQWFIKILDHKKELLEQGNKIAWHPPYMKTRYDNWVEGLNQDWCMSRQRYFGVPFPVWYPVLSNGEPDYQNPIFATKQQLPADPMSSCPEGFTEADRGTKFIADPDVMDTWATSSLTPQLMSHWSQDEDRHKKVFPMDIRPQSHEIIRTWAFYTITKAWMHEGEIPWKNVAISGWVLDPDRKKMSKSKGNVVTPGKLLDEYSSDAIRYWSAKARLGADTAFEESVFAIGKKLVTKLFNASKFVMMQIADADNLTEKDITVEVDRDYINTLRSLIETCGKQFEDFNYANALDRAEAEFWQFCDHYIELVKTRAYKEEDQAKRRSAQATLKYSLKTFLLLLAPFIPYITDEVWSWSFAKDSEKTSIHNEAWPTGDDFKDIEKPIKDALVEKAIIVLTEIRGAKTQAQKNMKHPVQKLDVAATKEDAERIEIVMGDLINAGSVEDYSVTIKDSQELIETTVLLAV
ncbi:valine--tRNA ligase [Candidatus Marinamargulisbacteria bacterium SCGC AAA071-K20]|nr:valine--tRNA ligase [Candidatus Marinamargulisbacteria bacterium SCGC AAA071-K20]